MQVGRQRQIEEQLRGGMDSSGKRIRTEIGELRSGNTETKQKQPANLKS